MIEQGGIDATDSFEDIGHSSDARDIMQKYKIGTLKASATTGSKAANSSSNSKNSQSIPKKE